MIPIPRDQFISRINRGAPSADYLSGVINRMFNAIEDADAQRHIEKIKADRNLSEVGKREQLDKITKAQIRTLCENSKALRSAKNQILGERMHLGKPKFDPTDFAAASERMEVRNALRAEPDPIKRWQKAEGFFAQSKEYAEALLSGPNAGLDGERLKQLHDRFLKTYYGDELANIEARDNDLEPLKGAVIAAHAMLRSRSGLNEHQYNQLVQSHEDEIDGKVKAAA